MSDSHIAAAYFSESNSIARRLASFAFYQWPKAGIGWGLMAAIAVGGLYAVDVIDTRVALAFWIACAYTFHQFEEYVVPGGFVEDFTRNFLQIKGVDRILDSRAVFLVNIPLIWVGLPCLALATAFVDSAWLAPAAWFSILAGLAHIVPIVKSKFTRWYNPGLAMSLTLSIPLGVAGAVTAWDPTSKVHNGGILTIAVFWALFVGWGQSLRRRYLRTGDPGFDRAWKEVLLLYVAVAVAAGLFAAFIP